MQVTIDFGTTFSEPVRWTVPKLYMLTALRHAEKSPDHGAGVAVVVRSGQTPVARSLARHGLTKMGRAQPPDHGVTVALTDLGRTVVDTILDALNGMGEPG